jgi:hypothetical protein
LNRTERGDIRICRPSSYHQITAIKAINAEGDTTKREPVLVRTDRNNGVSELISTLIMLNLFKSKVCNVFFFNGKIDPDFISTLFQLGLCV